MFSPSAWLFFPPLSFSFPWPFLFSVSLSLPSCGWSYVAEEPYLIWEGKQRKASAFVCIYIYVYLNIHIHLSLCKCVYENPPHLRTHQGITMYFYVYLHKYTHTHTPFHIDFVLITMRMKKQQEGAARTTSLHRTIALATGEVPRITHTDSPSALLKHTTFPALYMPMSFCLLEIKPHGEKGWPQPSTQSASTPWSHPDLKAGKCFQV